MMGEETQNSVPLHDPHGRFADWKNRLTPLPQPVRKKIEEVSRHRRGAFEEIWKEAIEQGDLIHVYGLLCQAAHDWLIALHARNGWFLSTPRWSQRRMRTFDVIPFDARNRLLYIIGSVRNIQEAVRRWEELRRLWLELPAE